MSEFAKLGGRVQALGSKTLTPEELQKINEGDGDEDDVQVYRVELSILSDNDLVMLRSRINGMLAERGVERLNLRTEFEIQLAHARGLQADLRAGSGKPNERASALTAVNSVLGSLVKLREQVANQERLMALETAIVRLMREQAPAVREKFLAAYEKLTTTMGDAQ